MMNKILTIVLFLISTLTYAQESDMRLVSIKSKSGKHKLEMNVINYGARIQALKVDGVDVVLGFDTLVNYASVKQNFGAVVGRYIGRIIGGNLDIDGQHYQLQTGSNGDCSHGGTPSFSQRYWYITSLCDSSVTLRYVSPDGENGFPGELDLNVKYTLTSSLPTGEGKGEAALRIDYEANTTKQTVLNPSNHSFFNLSGDLGKDVLNESLEIYSDSIALYDSNKRVTGQLFCVTNTPFDFRSTHLIGERIDEDNDQLNVTKGYDHCYKLNGEANQLKHAAKLHDNGTGLTMNVYTTEPAMQIYTANGHKGNIIGRSGSAGFDKVNDSKKEGKAYPRRNAICFETMHFPDSPNKPQWPSTLLRPGETFHSTTIFEFDK